MAENTPNEPKLNAEQVAECFDTQVATFEADAKEQGDTRKGVQYRATAATYRAAASFVRKHLC